MIPRQESFPHHPGSIKKDPLAGYCYGAALNLLVGTQKFVYLSQLDGAANPDDNVGVEFADPFKH